MKNIRNLYMKIFILLFIFIFFYFVIFLFIYFFFMFFFFKLKFSKYLQRHVFVMKLASKKEKGILEIDRKRWNYLKWGDMEPHRCSVNFSSP